MKSQGTKYQVILDLNPRERATALQMVLVVYLSIRGTVSDGAARHLEFCFHLLRKQIESVEAAWCGWA